MRPDKNQSRDTKVPPTLVQLKRPERDSGVVVKLDLPSADTANDAPSVFPRRVAQFLSRKCAHNRELRRMRHGILGFHRERLRDLRDHGGQSIVHRSQFHTKSAKVTKFGGLDGLS